MRAKRATLPKLGWWGARPKVLVFLHLNHGVWGKRAFKSMRTPIVFALVRVMFPLFGRAVADLASGQVFGKRATSAFQKQPFRPAKAIFLQAKSRPLVLRKLVFDDVKAGLWFCESWSFAFPSQPFGIVLFTFLFFYLYKLFRLHLMSFSAACGPYVFVIAA